MFHFTNTYKVLEKIWCHVAPYIGRRSFTKRPRLESRQEGSVP